MATNRSKEEWKNIWQKNGIPQLEFCSIERASQLLDCQTEDIYHWINTSKIFPSVFFESLVKVNIHAHVTGDEMAEEEIIGFIYSEVSKPTKISIDYGVKGYSMNELGNYSADPEFTDNSVHNYINNVTSLHIPGSIIGLWTPSFFDPWHTKSSQIINSQNSIFMPHKIDNVHSIIYVTLLDDVEIHARNLMLTRDDIERIYIAAQKGEELTTLKPLSNEKESVAEEKITIHQVDMIFDLLGLLITESDPLVAVSEPAKINRKLASLAAKKGKQCKIPDPKTWERWANKRLSSKTFQNS
ncbi:hypothetical protein [Morganella morganii]|uniref:hypothetical protein n=1 Tax=Morganella morganii TaxID=582 RepID=UPI00052BF8FC|nr:hypothetical protein [Morganella morganii]KGP43409.1 hypothetical protein LR61_14210 [Morganella morganii]